MKAILIDDEELALSFLEKQIQKVGSVEVIGKFHIFDLKKNANLLEETDVVLLDIEMPGVNGIELAEKILEIDPMTSIIFVTAFNDYAIQAFEVNALDYILKPIQFERLNKSLGRVKEKSSNRAETLVDKPFLRVNVSSELSFESSQNQPEFIKWRTKKSEELFLYLLYNNGKSVRKYELIDLLWADFDEEKAFSQLYTAVYHIRKALSKYGSHFKINNLGEAYLLSTNKVEIDVVEWENRLHKARPINSDTIEMYEEMMKLYKGSYLESYSYIWAEPEKYRLLRLWLKIAYPIAAYYLQQEDDEKAKAWYLNICKMNPDEEGAHFELMKLYEKSGEITQVERHYEQMKMTMHDLGLTVNPVINKWFSQWKKQLIEK